MEMLSCSFQKNDTSSTVEMISCECDLKL